MKKNNAGLTLIELIVILVVVVSVGLGIFYLGRWRGSVDGTKQVRQEAVDFGVGQWSVQTDGDGEPSVAFCWVKHVPLVGRLFSPPKYDPNNTLDPNHPLNRIVPWEGPVECEVTEGTFVEYDTSEWEEGTLLSAGPKGMWTAANPDSPAPPEGVVVLSRKEGKILLLPEPDPIEVAHIWWLCDDNTVSTTFKSNAVAQIALGKEGQLLFLQTP